jgi:cell wall-associated NlpC family hydrolase
MSNATPPPPKPPAEATRQAPAGGPPPDPRRTVWREDLAADVLWDTVLAPRYAAAVRRRVWWPVVAQRRRPDASLPFENELMFGEAVNVYEDANGWSWVQARRDRYVGYVPSEALADAGATPTHRVRALGTFIYPAADIKAPPLMALSLGAELTVIRETERFLELSTGGYCYGRHLAPLARRARDFVEVAERFIGVPYLWGGRTRLGVDCSGLVQVAMEAAGLVCPRDTDMQQGEVGSQVLVPKDLEGLERGDLVFWPGHVGIMTDGVMLLHANAHHMSVVSEPLVVAARRIKRTAGAEVVAVRRPPSIGSNADASESDD